MKTHIYKELLIPVFFTFIAMQSFSQDMVFGRADFITGNGFDKVTDIHIDKSDNLYITGTFEKGGSINGISVKQSDENTLFVAKYNQEGYIQYTKQFSGSGKIYVHSLTSDTEENLYISGSFRKSCSFGELTLESGDFQDNFIVKISTEGNFLWVKQIDADTKAEKQILLCDGEDNLIIGGTYYKSISLENKTVTSKSASDIYLMVLDKEGNLNNLMSFGGKNADRLNDMVLSNENRLYISGTFSQDLQLGHKTLVSNGRKDAFWAEIDPARTGLDKEDHNPVKEHKQIGGRFDDAANKIMIYDNVLYVSGSFQDKVKYRKEDLVSKGIKDVFLCRYKLNGRELGATTIGGKGNEYPHGMLVNDKGEIYIIGNFRGLIETEDDKTYTGHIETKEHQSDNFVTKLDKDGNILNLFSFGGEDNDFPVEAAMTKDNTIFLTGTYRSDFEFGNKRSLANSKNNIFLTEMYDCTNLLLELGEDIEVCGEYTELKTDAEFATYSWSNGSSNNQTKIENSGSYELIVKDKDGCSAKDDIYVNLLPLPEVDLGEDFELHQGEELTLNVLPGYKEYRWNGEKGSEDYKIKAEELTPGEHSFTVLVTDNNGCTCTDRINIIIKENENDDLNATDLSAKIVPNPSDGRFTLYINNANPKQEVLTEIYTPNGKLIKRQKIDQKSDFIVEKINIQKQAKGDYLLRIINGDAIVSKTLIITN